MPTQADETADDAEQRNAEVAEQRCVAEAFVGDLDHTRPDSFGRGQIQRLHLDARFWREVGGALVGQRDLAAVDFNSQTGSDALAVHFDDVGPVALLDLVIAIVLDQPTAPGGNRIAVIQGKAVAGIDLWRVFGIFTVVDKNGHGAGVGRSVRSLDRQLETCRSHERAGHMQEARQKRRAGERTPEKEDRDHRNDRGSPVRRNRAFVAKGHRLQRGVVGCTVGQRFHAEERNNENGDVYQKDDHAFSSARPMISSSMSQIMPRISSRVGA